MFPAIRRNRFFFSFRPIDRYLILLGTLGVILSSNFFLSTRLVVWLWTKILRRGQWNVLKYCKGGITLPTSKSDQLSYWVQSIYSRFKLISNVCVCALNWFSLWSRTRVSMCTVCCRRVNCDVFELQCSSSSWRHVSSWYFVPISFRIDSSLITCVKDIPVIDQRRIRYGSLACDSRVWFVIAVSDISVQSHSLLFFKKSNKR
jgi:hypothetical protein